MPRRWRSRPSLVALVAAALLAAACPSERPRPSLPRERPPPAGTLRLAYPEEPPSLNPVTDGSPASGDILQAVLPSFFLVTPELEYRPYLLASEPQVQRSGNRMVVRFRIREEARWSDGRPVTVEDVAFTWRVMSDPDLDVARPDGFDHVVDVMEESPKLGRLVLSPPLASWRELFSAGRFVLPGHVTANPAGVEDWNRGPPVGAGPFTIRRVVPGRSVLLSAHPGFFGAAPLVRTIEVAFVPDPTTAVQLLTAGQVDAVAPTLGISWSHRLASIPGVELSEAYGPDLVHLVFNADRIPDPEDRRGIARSIDRSRFVEGVVNEEGVRADGIFAPEQLGAVPEWEEFGDGSGGSVPEEELDLVYTNTELLDFLARFVQAEVERAGGDVELVPLEADDFQGLFLPQRDFDMALWESRSGPAPSMARWVSIPGSAEPVTGLSDRMLVQLASRMEAGREGAGVALAEAQSRLAELIPVLPVYQPKVTMAWRSGIAGLQANPTVEGPLWNTWEWSQAG
jgi:peptide/nickel transport system substrate-binding protein